MWKLSIWRAARFRWIAAILALATGVAPLSAEAGCKIVSRGFKSYLKCTGDVAQTLGRGTEVLQETVGKPLGEGVKAIGAGVAHLGDQIGRETGDFGRNFNQAMIKAGHDINKVAIDVGKELERAGQKLGNALEEITDLSLDCDDPLALRGDIAESYSGSCSDELSHFRSDAALCEKAGGISVIAAGMAASLKTFGASLALAKAAFEFCDAACREQNRLQSCIAEVDSGAQVAEQGAILAAEASARLERRAEAYKCRDEALTTELMLHYAETMQRCEALADCDPKEPGSEAWFIDETATVQKDIVRRRAASRAAFSANQELDESDYGPAILAPGSAEIAITTGISDRMPDNRVCTIEGQQATFWTQVKGKSGEVVRHRWLYADQQQDEFELVFTLEHAVGSDAWRVWSNKTIPASQRGRWIVLLVDAHDEILAQHVFLATPVVTSIGPDG